MSNITCKLIINDVISTHSSINFYEDENNAIIKAYILKRPTPKLRISCYALATQINSFHLDLYEYAINYIIDNKIGKYSNIVIVPYENIIIYFDIIDTNLLLQLI